MSDLPAAVEQALEASAAFSPTAEGAELTTTAIDASVTAESRSGDPAFTVTIHAPSLAASVEGDVAEIVESDWRETLERRLSDVFSVTTAARPGTLSVDPAGDTVDVTLEYTAEAARGVADAKALAEYVEGTYVQGLIPGYTYTGKAGRLLDRAQDRGDRS